MNKVQGIVEERKGWQYHIEDLFADYREYLEAANRSKKTINGYLDSLSGFSKFLGKSNLSKPLHELGKNELTKYVLYLKDRDRWANNSRILQGGKLSPHTIFAYIRDIKVFWSWLFKENYINRNPIANFPLPKLPKLVMPTLDPDQIRKLLARVDRSTSTGSMYFSMIILLLDTGIRLSELTNLKISDVNLDGKWIKVRGKGQKERFVPISGIVRKFLVYYVTNHRLKICKVNSDYLFPDSDGHNISANAVQQFLRRLAKSAGFNGVKCSAHVFRHTFATRSLANGANIEILRVILGHESIQTTARYTHLQPADIQKQHSKFSPAAEIFMPKSLA